MPDSLRGMILEGFFDTITILVNGILKIVVKGMSLQAFKHILFRYKATWSYILLVVVLNKLYTLMPLLSITGEEVSPFDFAVGMVYIFRDFAQREIGRRVIIAMLLAGLLSYIFADHKVAYASLCAFMVGEFIDWAIFTYTNKPLSQRILWSALVSTPIDSFVFLYVVGRINFMAMSIMTLTKILGVVAVWALWRFRKTKASALLDANQCHSPGGSIA